VHHVSIHAFLSTTMLVATMAVSRSADAQVRLPADWRWATDRPARVVASDSVTDSTWRFAQMPPGWHITTKPGALAYDPRLEATGRYAIESTQLLFPGTSTSGYGIFIGGRSMESANREYVAVLIRRDGSVMVERHVGSSVSTLLPWTTNTAIKRATGDAPVENVIRAAVEPDSVRLSVNGTRVGGFARGALALDGQFGFRTGPDLNLHITTLDHIRRIAPMPPG
jgi:hypothetical protein